MSISQEEKVCTFHNTARTLHCGKMLTVTLCFATNERNITMTQLTIAVFSNRAKIVIYCEFKPVLPVFPVEGNFGMRLHFVIV